MEKKEYRPVKVPRMTLKEARKRYTKYKAYQVAEMLGVASTTVSSWENGKTLPNCKYLDAICKLYGVYRGQLILKLKDEDKYV